MPAMSCASPQRWEHVSPRGNPEGPLPAPRETQGCGALPSLRKGTDVPAAAQHPEPQPRSLGTLTPEGTCGFPPSPAGASPPPGGPQSLKERGEKGLPFRVKVFAPE